MNKFGVRVINCIVSAALVTGRLLYPSVPVYAERTISEVEEEINRIQEEIEGIDDEIISLSDEQDLILEQMDDLNAEIINMMASISLLEEEIAQKELDIADTQQKYEEAKQVEENQMHAMSVQVKLMYEGGTISWFNLLLSSSSFADLLNKVTYTEEVLQYSSDLLKAYEETKNQVHDLWDQLEIEKTELEADKADLEGQKDYCDELMAELKKKSDNYDALIAQAQTQAKEAKSQLKQEQQELKRLQEEERKRQEEEKRRQAALNATYTKTSYTDIIDNASGSDLGKKIAKFACQYIGNPYVYGGTSLTNGADCSGFTYRVYQNFGYTIPRTSYEQRSVGVAVDYANAQPGDLICYSGHVGLYIGGGYIVHASNQRTGIKVSKATYRTIVAVRRVIN